MLGCTVGFKGGPGCCLGRVLMVVICGQVAMGVAPSTPGGLEQVGRFSGGCTTWARTSPRGKISIFVFQRKVSLPGLGPALSRFPSKEQMDLEPAGLALTNCGGRTTQFITRCARRQRANVPAKSRGKSGSGRKPKPGPKRRSFDVASAATFHGFQRISIQRLPAVPRGCARCGLTTVVALERRTIGNKVAPLFAIPAAKDRCAKLADSRRRFSVNTTLVRSLLRSIFVDGHDDML